jgi:hypothetical protein
MGDLRVATLSEIGFLVSIYLKIKNNNMKNKKKMIKGDFLKIENDIILHKKIENFLTFEIGDEITNDIAEAVCMLMLKIDDDDPIWDKKIENNSLLIRQSRETSGSQWYTWF